MQNDRIFWGLLTKEKSVCTIQTNETGYIESENKL